MPLLRISIRGCPPDNPLAMSPAALPSHRPAFSRVSACGLIRRVNRRTPGFRAAEDRVVRRRLWDWMALGWRRRFGLRPPAFAGAVEYATCYGMFGRWYFFSLWIRFPRRCICCGLILSPPFAIVAMDASECDALGWIAHAPCTSCSWAFPAFIHLSCRPFSTENH